MPVAGFAQAVAPRLIELQDGPLFRSTADDLITAWRACANAVEGRGGTVDRGALMKMGWAPAVLAVDGKPLGDQSADMFFFKQDMSAMIVVGGQSCVVEGLVEDYSLSAPLEQAIATYLQRIASARGVNYERRLVNGRHNFGAPYTGKAFFAVSLSYGRDSSLLELFSRSLGGMKAIKILTLDKYRNKE
ncbi:MAG: hypothetical protein A4S16_04145 [Proteobacteria bacterium SG_bin6]|nr:MAG: hypothetical protein A4S16_04145 [Proteobacteria bacterium SG_bin6]